jgi:hypothetical protein
MHTWRGPAWMNVAWLLRPALHELGYDDDTDRMAAAVGRDGLRECYDPRTAGLAARGFSRTALVADLASA